MSNYQSGFRSLHSTLAALLEGTNNSSINIDNGLLNVIIFIDLKKAFGTIDHEIVLRKLANYGVYQSSLRFFVSYLSNRCQKCSVNGALSSVSELTCGVPQGSILYPLLFLIYINELPNCLTTAFYLFITIYSIQYKYIKEIKITKQTKSCGEGDNQKRKSTILGMSPHY